jgi:hypothetical protein
MACNISNAIPLDCMSALGGIDSIFVFSGTYVEQTIASGEVTLTGGNSQDFFQYKFAKDTAKFTETATISSANGTVFYTQELSVTLNKRETAKRNELLLLAQNRENRVIFLDLMGQYWLLGNGRGAVLSALVGEGGQAIGDMNGYNFTFQAMESEPCPMLVSANGTSITAIAPLATATVGGFDFTKAA